MPKIELLTQETIDKIAAGEVIERPSSVVKELVENALDAGANVITVEIKDGGISFIRITDNGCGIEKDQIPLAFLRHSTSKIRSVEDLLTVSSLGFRGEALSSIAAVAQVELITKPVGALMGVRYVIEGSKEKAKEEIGAPDGTTFLIRNIFYNTPARRKFLKTAQTEGSYISGLMEHMALSHPNVAFKFIANNQTKLQTSGNGNIKEIIYHIYGRDITAALMEIHGGNEEITIHGFVGKPVVTRGNRNFENYFINGRYIKSRLISKSIEDAYKNFMMLHQYPFTVLYLEMDGQLLDVNVHPAKMELRFQNGEGVYDCLRRTLEDALYHKDLIPKVPVAEEKPPVKPVVLQHAPEPFEKNRMPKRPEPSVPQHIPQAVHVPEPALKEKEADTEKTSPVQQITRPDVEPKPEQRPEPKPEEPDEKKITEQKPEEVPAAAVTHQMTLAEDVTYGAQFLQEDTKARRKIIGQLFDTYWLIEFEDKLFIIDQHAAHEKVLYEKTMATLKTKEFSSQQLSPPAILSLTMPEEEILKKYLNEFEKLGYAVEHFGGREYAVCAVPANIFGVDVKQLFMEMLGDLEKISGKLTPDIILHRVATMSCKAAIKGNQKITVEEMEQLFDDLMKLENPYNCPHGRPTIISMTKYEIEKKFKRIV